MRTIIGITGITGTMVGDSRKRGGKRGKRMDIQKSLKDTAIIDVMEGFL
jgi:hypothetical protein